MLFLVGLIFVIVGIIIICKKKREVAIKYRDIDEYAIYMLTDPPIIVGGKAMEYYCLRQAKDIDFIISDRDYQELLNIVVGHRDGPITCENGIFTIGGNDYAGGIRKYNYNYFKEKAISVASGKYFIISRGDLILTKAIVLFESESLWKDRYKAFTDLKLLIN